MKGYKAFNYDLTCKDFQYEVGKEFVFDGKPIPCQQGFHFCRLIADCYNFYPMSESTRICEVEAVGDIETNDDIKYCTNKIKVVREITDEQTKKANTTASSTGYCNTGDCNTGDWNTGNRNTGDWNTGNRNTGNCNTGDWNTGNRNTGDWNTGNRNTGNRNTGNRNTGDWNVSSYNTGCFMTEEQKISLFNKTSEWTYREWLNCDARFILRRCPCEYNDTEWISSENMTDKEKKEHPTHETTGGYLKVVKHEADRQTWWNNLSREDKDTVMSLPNFDAEIFKKCTGIEVRGEQA